MTLQVHVHYAFSLFTATSTSSLICFAKSSVLRFGTQPSCCRILSAVQRALEKNKVAIYSLPKYFKRSSPVAVKLCLLRAAERDERIPAGKRTEQCQFNWVHAA